MYHKKLLGHSGYMFAFDVENPHEVAALSAVLLSLQRKTTPVFLAAVVSSGCSLQELCDQKHLKGDPDIAVGIVSTVSVIFEILTFGFACLSALFACMSF